MTIASARVGSADNETSLGSSQSPAAAAFLQSLLGLLPAYQIQTDCNAAAWVTANDPYNSGCTTAFINNRLGIYPSPSFPLPQDRLERQPASLESD